MTTRRTLAITVTALAAGAMALSACSGGGSSSSTTSAPASESPIGGGEAECTEAVMTENAQGAAEADGATFVSFESFECVDGYAITFAITESGGIEQTSAYVFQAEGPIWAQQQLSALCADGGGEGVPQTILDQACALR
jgi:hypothetical protein